MGFFVVVIEPTTFAPARFRNISDFTNLLAPTLILGAALLFFILLIYAGFLYMRSEGSAEELKKVKNLLTYSIIGFGIIISSFLIIKIIGLVFNIQNLIPF